MIPTSQGRAYRRVASGTALITVAAMAMLGMQAVPATATPVQAPRGDSGQLPAKVSAQEYRALVSTAKAQQDATASELKLGDKVELTAKGVVKNKDGTTHTRYLRTYKGLPVLGGDLIVHRAPSGKIERVTQGTTAKLNVNTAPRALASHQPAKSKAAGSAAPRKIVWMQGSKAVLAWETVVGGTQKDGSPNELHVITNAATGKRITDWQGFQTSTGNSQFSGPVDLGTTSSAGQFLLRDAGRGNHETTDLNGSTIGHGTLFADVDDVWGNGSPTDRQTAAVDAAYGAGVTWDFYKTIFGRSGIRGDGVGALSRVHYGINYDNAGWLDSCFCMSYGDGYDNNHPLTELDVAGHEMTHGVTAATAGLIYRNESGGLNEATSDIMGSAMEFWANNPNDPGDYLLGEKIDIFGTGQPLRFMDRPSRDGRSADYWSSSVGNLNVHFSSGVANHFFYLLSEGSGAKVINGVSYDSPTYDGNPVSGIGRDKATAIWYKALTEEMNPRTNYADARRATLVAASALYGPGSVEYNATANAWNAVNVRGSRRIH